MIGGFAYTQARRLKPGFLLDVYKTRMEYDLSISMGGIGKIFGGKRNRK